MLTPLFTFSTKVRTVRLSFLLVQPNFTYGPYAARGYRVKLQRWEYTEQRTQENPNLTH